MQTEKPLHSPLPWLWVDCYEGIMLDTTHNVDEPAVIYASYEWDDDGTTVRPILEIESEANKDFLLKAVNNHYQLVEALYDLVAFAEMLDGFSPLVNTDAFLALEAGRETLQSIGRLPK